MNKKKIKEALEILNPKSVKTKFVSEDKNCKHNKWCDSLNTNPFCLECGWGTSESIINKLLIYKGKT